VLPLTAELLCLGLTNCAGISSYSGAVLAIWHAAS